MLFAGILFALLTISASNLNVGRTTKARDEELAGATYLGGYVLLVGGSGESMETWTPTTTDGPQYNPLPPHNFWGSRAAVLESRLFSCGGGYPDALKDCYTTQAPDWKPAPSLQVGRRDYSLTAVEGSLVAAGGTDDDSNWLSSVEILGETGWSTASWSLKAPVHSHCAVSFQGELVIAGGLDGSGVSVTKYNIRTGERSSLPNLPYGAYGHACTIFNDAITFSGGAGDGLTDKVWQLINNNWVELPSLKRGRWGHAMGVLEGQLFVFGGDSSNTISTVERLTADGWEEVEQGLQGTFFNGGAIFIE